MQALAQALPGDASVYLLLGMLRNAKGNKEAAANAYAAAVRISLVSSLISHCLAPLTKHGAISANLTYAYCLLSRPCMLHIQSMSNLFVLSEIVLALFVMYVLHDDEM